MPPVQDVATFLAIRDQGLPLLDVRSPGEFAFAHIPGALNLPLFTDEERAKVGTAHARSGREGAVHLALELVGGHLAALLARARHLCGGKREVLLHCWRGGMRSDSMRWLLETGGFTVHRLEGGYKSYRTFVRNELARPRPILVLGGYTGCGKTDILLELQRLGSQVIDLEGLAHHKGSAFGALGQAEDQPGNEWFENQLYEQWRRCDPDRPVWLEDESRHIGHVTMCEEFFAQLGRSPLVRVFLPDEERVAHLVRDYGGQDMREGLLAALERLQRRLGGELIQRCRLWIDEGNYADAARAVLHYYDRCYAHQIENRQAPVIKELACTTDDPALAARLLHQWEQDLPPETFTATTPL